MKIDVNAITCLITALPQTPPAPALAKMLISMVDLTSLNDNDDETAIRHLCGQAHNNFQPVAAICVYPQFVMLAKEILKFAPIDIATVANFPSGDDNFSAVLADIDRSIEMGATEIDVVFPYQRYLHGMQTEALDFIRHCKQACGKKARLKVILETGKLANLQTIATVSYQVILAGANFIKTSTGKIPQGASLEAACAMLMAIQTAKTEGVHAGLKISGGVRTSVAASQYYHLAQTVMGDAWPTRETFRIGASSLLTDLFENFGVS